MSSNTTGPEAPPLRIDSRRVRSSLPLIAAPPWHLRQFASSTGRTSLSKKTRSAALNAGSAARGAVANPAASSAAAAQSLNQEIARVISKSDENRARGQVLLVCEEIEIVSRESAAFQLAPPPRQVAVFV